MYSATTKSERATYRNRTIIVNWLWLWLNYGWIATWTESIFGILRLCIFRLKSIPYQGYRWHWVFWWQRTAAFHRSDELIAFNRQLLLLLYETHSQFLISPARSRLLPSFLFYVFLSKPKWKTATVFTLSLCIALSLAVIHATAALGSLLAYFVSRRIGYAT